MKFLRMRPGHGEQLIAEGDVEVAEDEERLSRSSAASSTQGMWAAIPTSTETGRREAEMVRAFEEIPRDADRVIFFPRAAGGRGVEPRVTVALCATAIVVLALLWEVTLPVPRAPARARAAPARRAARRRRRAGYDPGRERRAEQRARELLKSCVNEEEWAMYRDLGFIRVWGGQAGGPPTTGRDLRGVPYAYLVYPHKPIVAYLPQTGRLLNEYCVEFPDETRPYGSPRLPDSDDVLAKWMALKGDERRLIAEANMHLPGRQVDPRQVQRDIWRLGRWERERLDAPRAARPRAAPRGRRPRERVRRP